MKPRFKGRRRQNAHGQVLFAMFITLYSNGREQRRDYHLSMYQIHSLSEMEEFVEEDNRFSNEV